MTRLTEGEVDGHGRARSDISMANQSEPARAYIFSMSSDFKGLFRRADVEIERLPGVRTKFKFRLDRERRVGVRLGLHACWNRKQRGRWDSLTDGVRHSQ